MARRMNLQTLVTRALEVKRSDTTIELVYTETPSGQMVPTISKIKLTLEQALALAVHISEMADPDQKDERALALEANTTPAQRKVA
jgi:hypothetical protein